MSARDTLDEVGGGLGKFTDKEPESVSIKVVLIG